MYLNLTQTLKYFHNSKRKQAKMSSLCNIVSFEQMAGM